MTVSNTTSRNQYTATSGQTVFPYTFEIFDKDDLVVLKNGTTLSEGTDYTVSGVGVDSGGNVTLVVGATAGDIITAYRDMPLQRLTDYQTSGDFLAQEVNDDFDRLWLATQQIQDGITRVLRAPETDSITVDLELDPVATRANKFLSFDGSGNVITVASVGSPATDASNVTFTQDVINAVGTSVEGKLNEVVSVKDFGATGDGSTDDSAAIQAAIDNVGATGSVYFPRGVYACNSISVTCDLDMDIGAIALFNGSNETGDGYVFDVTTTNIKIGRLYVSGNFKPCRAVKINSDDALIDQIRIINVSAPVTTTNVPTGLVIYGDNAHIGSVHVRDCQNTGAASESWPQAVVFSGEATNNYVEDVKIDNGSSGIVCASSGITGAVNNVGNVVCNNMTDNGLYQLGNTGLINISSIYYQGDDEPVVLKASANIGKVVAYGPTSYPGIEDCDDVYIGEINIVADPSISGRNGASAFLRTRSGNTASGNVHIGKLTGRYRGINLFYLANGTIEYLTIDSIDCVFDYDPTVNASGYNLWAHLTACKGFDIKNVNIRIVDETDNLPSVPVAFLMTGPISNLDKYSYINNIRVDIQDSSENPITDGYFRGLNFKGNSLIQYGGVNFDTSDRIREAGFGSGLANGVYQGTWTPVPTDAEASGNDGTATTAEGWYTVTGKMCHASFRLVDIDTTGMTGTNKMWVGGLPFAASTQTGTMYWTGSVRIATIAAITSDELGMMSMRDGASTAQIGPGLISDYGAGDDIYGTISYMID